MDFKLTAYPICVSNHERADELNNSNYILLPSTMLLDIEMGETPLLFTLTESISSRVHHCGVLEFIDEPGICYIPFHIYEKLKLDFGSTVSIRQHTCPTGSKIYLKPEETAFVQLDDPKTILEESINKHYPVLSTGDDIYILYKGRDFRIKVTRTLPNSSVKTLNCDIIVEFEEPDDLNVIQSSRAAATSAAAATAAAAAPLTNQVYDTARFPGIGHRLGSTKN